jgi:uncharacterized protein (DUF1697 family)
VGGHVVKMDRLRELFEALNLANVETFIASGNVLFDSAARNAAALEKKIGAHLEDTLGYEVVTFLRSLGELSKIAGYRPFPQAELEAKGASLYVGFVPAALSPAALRALPSFRTKTEDFRAYGREVYWLCRPGATAAGFSLTRFEKALGLRATFRNVNTVRRIVAKDSPEGRSVTVRKSPGSR